MFKNDKFVTKGIDSTVPHMTQLVMWSMIEKAREKTELDYLQVFELTPELKQGITMQKIVHSQEEPEYERTIYIVSDEPITAHIFCIDDETHSTMLLAAEY